MTTMTIGTMNGTMNGTTTRTTHARPRPVSRPPRARLTPRGRAVVVLAFALLLFGAFSLGRAGAQGSTTLERAPELQQTTVQPGETLWGVASRIAPGQDPRPVIDQIRRLNDLPDASLRAGQQLLLPARR
jgi:hypothetical protein